MLRTLLTVVLPLALPTVLYFLYQVADRRRIAAAETGAAAPWWAGTPWFTLAATGVGLMAAVLVARALFGGAPVGGIYRPARLVDGKVVPGSITPAGPAAIDPAAGDTHGDANSGGR